MYKISFLICYLTKKIKSPKKFHGKEQNKYNGIILHSHVYIC